MNHAVRAALEKYHGKKEDEIKQAPAGTGLLLIILLCVALFLGIKFNVFGLGNAWSGLCETKIVSQTVSAFKNGVSKVYSHFKTENNKLPLNDSGESGIIGEDLANRQTELFEASLSFGVLWNE